ncbi:MAG TPA: Fur family transcriptional regulator [Sporosarcina sp.]|nr:Fur family transcriptional regulator [Sporosarcina sp.]
MNIKHALDLLQQHGLKHTKNREVMLAFFDEQERYVTASDVKEFIEVNNPGISFDTIYRNLTTFTSLGILEETELAGERHFRMHCDAGVHHHHFICTVCGMTESIPQCPMDLLSVQLPNHLIESHKFEIYGRCPKCKVS